LKKWFSENWEFIIEVKKVGIDGDPRNCRIGLEEGDLFSCEYAPPENFCPTTFIKMFSLQEVLRSGGDLRALGGSCKNETEFICPDGVVKFKLKGLQKEIS